METQIEVQGQQQLNLVELAGKTEWKQMLVDIVQNEKLDPWNIDITVITSEYLSQIKKLKKLNLRMSANVVLAASILLRFKSDSWILKRNGEQEEQMPMFIPDSLYQEPEFPQLEPALRATTRKVTLDELIYAIEDIITKEKKKAEKRNYISSIRDLPQSLINIMASNPEDFEIILKEVYEKIKTSTDKDNLTLFSNLLTDKTRDDVIKNLIPVLHLATKQKITVWQEEFFGEIFINLLNDGHGS